MFSKVLKTKLNEQLDKGVDVNALVYLFDNKAKGKDDKVGEE